MVRVVELCHGFLWEVFGGVLEFLYVCVCVCVCVCYVCVCVCLRVI